MYLQLSYATACGKERGGGGKEREEGAITGLMYARHQTRLQKDTCTSFHIPMHILDPKPKGREANMWVALSFSWLHRSGRYLRGSGKISAILPITVRGMNTVV